MTYFPALPGDPSRYESCFPDGLERKPLESPYGDCPECDEELLLIHPLGTRRYCPACGWKDEDSRREISNAALIIAGQTARDYLTRKPSSDPAAPDAAATARRIQGLLQSARESWILEVSMLHGEILDSLPLLSDSERETVLMILRQGRGK